MEKLLQLHLEPDDKKSEAPNPSQQQAEEPKPLIVGKRLNRLARKAAHRAATEYGHSSGLFSK
jgi:hypothetical protein